MKRKYCCIQIVMISLPVLFFLSVTAQTIRQGSPSASMQVADSLYFAGDWKNARLAYEKALADTSTNSIAWNRLGFSCHNLGEYDAAMRYYKKALTAQPSRPVKASAYSRMARISAIKNKTQEALIELDSAFHAGYTNLSELDSLQDFSSIREEAAFKSLREKVYAAVFPCMVNAQAREFDFWIGEWDVFVTGTNQLAGQSVIQLISGGCAILENWQSAASTGKSINFINPVNNQWKQSWAGSYTNGVQEFVNGIYKDSAMRFEFETKDAAGNKVIGRLIFYNQGPSQVRQFCESSPDNGKTWTTLYDFTYKRKQ